MVSPITSGHDPATKEGAEYTKEVAEHTKMLAKSTKRLEIATWLLFLTALINIIMSPIPYKIMSFIMTFL